MEFTTPSQIRRDLHGDIHDIHRAIRYGLSVHEPRILTAARRAVRQLNARDVEPEEVPSVMFERAIRDAEPYRAWSRTTQRLRAFLRTRARLIVRELRRDRIRNRRIPSIDPEVVALVEGACADPSDIIAEREGQQTIDDLLASIEQHGVRESDRPVLRSLVNGDSQDAMARQLGMSPRAAKNARARVRHAIRRTLERRVSALDIHGIRWLFDDEKERLASDRD